MGIPISAMVAATEFNAADVFPMVQAGANLKCTRSVFLSAVPTESISMSAGGSNITIASNGDAEILLATTHAIKMWHGAADNFFVWGPGGETQFQVKAGFNWQVTTGLGNQLLIDNLGNVILLGAAGAAIQIQVGANSIVMLDGGGVTCSCDAGVNFFIPYLDGSGGAWKVAPPADLNTAIDRIAAWIHTNFAVLIP